MCILKVYILYMRFKTSKKLFIHVDCDCFFASCEVLKNPKLKWKRVCVWSEIIVAATYEAKALWIKTWTPIWDAKKILGNSWYYFPGDHEFYSIVSDRLMNYLESNTLSIEPFSIDEAFCEITWLADMYKLTVWAYVRKLQKDIYKTIWIPVSIWVSNTRIKAKIYSKINKPYWVYIWHNTSQELKLFKKLPIKNIPYIWKSSQEKLKNKCKNIYDFVSLWFRKIKEILGKNGTDLRLELSWVNAFVVKKSPEIKSISRSRSFNKVMTCDFSFLKAQILEHFSIVFEEITRKNFEIKCVSLMFRDKDFRVYIYDHKFSEHTNIRSQILERLLVLLDTYYNPQILYRSTWVILSAFRSYLPRQMSLFDKPLRSKEHNYMLVKIIDNLNTKYWNHKVSFWFGLLDKSSGAKLGIRR